jgi:PAS domain S-box-containing protein
MTATDTLVGATFTAPEIFSTADPLGIEFALVIIDFAPDGILVSDDNGRILMANRQIETLFGYDQDALVGSPVENLLPARLRTMHDAHRASFATAPALRPMGVGLELVGCRADGSEFPIEVSLSPAVTGQGIATIAIIRDVTRQRALEHAARTAATLDHDERIAADLHDRVIGHLFGCGLTLASILGGHQSGDRITQRLHEVINELDNAVYEIRDTVLGPSSA